MTLRPFRAVAAIGAIAANAVAAAAACTLPAFSAHAACMTDAEVSALFDACSRAQPAANPAELNTADGECSSARFNRMLALQMGEPVGYKAGLTNPAAQESVNAPAPVWGLPGTPKVQVSFK